MQIQISSDHNIDAHEALVARVTTGVESALSRVSDHITRVEIHLSDENGRKGGQNDKRCVIEARLKGRRPIATSDHAETLDRAVTGATDKLLRLIEGTLDRAARSERSRDSVGHTPI